MHVSKRSEREHSETVQQESLRWHSNISMYWSQVLTCLPYTPQSAADIAKYQDCETLIAMIVVMVVTKPAWSEKLELVTLTVDF